jgi:hypothetical protein
MMESDRLPETWFRRHESAADVRSYLKRSRIERSRRNATMSPEPPPQPVSTKDEDCSPELHRSVSYASSCSSAASAASGNSRARRHSRRRRTPRHVRRAGKAAVKMPSRSSSGSRSRSDKELALLQNMYICECCPKKPKKFDTDDELRQGLVVQSRYERIS